MVNIDLVEKGLVVQKKAKFNMVELYKTLKSWFDLHDYDFQEREYGEETADKKSTKIGWMGRKDVNEYVSFRVPISITLKNYETIKTKSGNIVEGDITVKISANVRSDYENKWQTSPVIHFFRAVFDRIIASDKTQKYEKELKKDVNDIFYRTKSYLNLQKFN